MAITNYTELQTSIADWLNRSDLSAVIPDFIRFVEIDLNRSLRVRQMVSRTRAVVNTQFYKLPIDFLELRNIEIVGDPVIPLRLLTSIRADERRRALSGRGRPVYYSIFQDNLEFVPIPSGDTTIEILYYKNIPALSATNTTNWLLTKYPDLYLYGSLLQSAPYLNDDSLYQVYGQKYASILEAIKNDNDRARHSGATLEIPFNTFG